MYSVTGLYLISDVEKPDVINLLLRGCVGKPSIQIEGLYSGLFPVLS
jgi:hypothetical protein